MNITEYIHSKVLFLDGGMGTLLQEAGLSSGEIPENWNISHPDEVVKIHRDYFNSGSNVVNTNTFGANSLKFPDEGELDAVIKAAIENARQAAAESDGSQEKYVALDVGPTGRLLKPFGDMDFEACVDIFKKTITIGVKYGVDLIMIETMNDCYETKAAVVAAKESCDLPVFVSNAYEESGKLMTGADPTTMIAMLEGLGADAVGVNCSLGPKALLPVVEQYIKYASVPVFFKPNAGLPTVVDWKTVYNVKADEFAEDVSSMVKNGVRIAGGCCGTTPEYIKALVTAVGDTSDSPAPIADKPEVWASSYAKAVHVTEDTEIGESIDPNEDEELKEALLDEDIDTLVDLAMDDAGDCDIISVNVAVDGVDEAEMIVEAIYEIQMVAMNPLKLVCKSPEALEAGLRHYIGKAMVGLELMSDADKDVAMESVRKYGAVVVA